MGAAMFLRTLAERPGLFAHNHVLHNATAGNFPPEIEPILAAKRGKVMATCTPPGSSGPLQRPSEAQNQ